MLKRRWRNRRVEREKGAMKCWCKWKMYNKCLRPNTQKDEEKYPENQIKKKGERLKARWEPYGNEWHPWIINCFAQVSRNSSEAPLYRHLTAKWERTISLGRVFYFNEKTFWPGSIEPILSHTPQLVSGSLVRTRCFATLVSFRFDCRGRRSLLRLLHMNFSSRKCCEGE